MADATVDWSPLPSAQDAVDGVLHDVTCVNEAGEHVESGSRFSVGDSVTTCSASDKSGNEGRCGFSTNVTGWKTGYQFKISGTLEGYEFK